MRSYVEWIKRNRETSLMTLGDVVIDENVVTGTREVQNKDFKYDFFR